MPDLINREIDFGDTVNSSSTTTTMDKNTGKIINLKSDKEDLVDDEETRILNSNIPKADWMREVERVGSKLKIDYTSITSSYNTSEWRSHIEQIKNNDKTLAKSIPGSRQALENLSEEVEKIMDKISKKESIISKNFTKIISDYKGRNNEKNSQLEEFNQLRNKVDKMQKDFEELEDKLVDLNVIFKHFHIKCFFYFIVFSFIY